MDNSAIARVDTAPERRGMDVDYWESMIDEQAAADFLGISVRTVQALRVRGGGPRYCRISARCIRYRRRDLQEWAEARLRTSTSEGSEAS